MLKGKCSLAKGVSKQPLLLFIFLFLEGKHPKFDRGDSASLFSALTLPLSGRTAMRPSSTTSSSGRTASLSAAVCKISSMGGGSGISSTLGLTEGLCAGLPGLVSGLSKFSPVSRSSSSIDSCFFCA